MPAAFAEEIILAIDVDHALLEDTLPLVLDACHLLDWDRRSSSVGGQEGSSLMTSVPYRTCKIRCPSRPAHPPPDLRNPLSPSHRGHY